MKPACAVLRQVLKRLHLVARVHLGTGVARGSRAGDGVGVAAPRNRVHAPGDAAVAACFWLPALAQIEQLRKHSTSIISALGFLLLLILVVAGIGAVVRRRLLRDEDATAQPDAFTLSDLRRLHENGDLTDEEFQRAKALVIARAREHLQSDEVSDQAADPPPTGDDAPPGSENGTDANRGPSFPEN